MGRRTEMEKENRVREISYGHEKKDGFRVIKEMKKENRKIWFSQYTFTQNMA